MNYFKLEEFLKSDTALQNKIANLPSWEVVNNLIELKTFLNPLREKWGSAIIITSGYRCDELNRILPHSSPTSVHKIGYACDMIPANGKFEQFKQFLFEYLKDKNYDQIIVETNGLSRWIHLGLYNNAGQQRKIWMKKDLKLGYSKPESNLIEMDIENQILASSTVIDKNTSIETTGQEVIEINLNDELYHEWE